MSLAFLVDASIVFCCLFLSIEGHLATLGWTLVGFHLEVDLFIVSLHLGLGAGSKVAAFLGTELVLYLEVYLFYMSLEVLTRDEEALAVWALIALHFLVDRALSSLVGPGMMPSDFILVIESHLTAFGWTGVVPELEMDLLMVSFHLGLGAGGIAASLDRTVLVLYLQVNLFHVPLELLPCSEAALAV